MEVKMAIYWDTACDYNKSVCILYAVILNFCIRVDSVSKRNIQLQCKKKKDERIYRLVLWDLVFTDLVYSYGFLHMQTDSLKLC